tara:strand:- start:283 stop:498 length:216 start_codon:yes stop_codon:yes gene_type:complete
MNYNWVLYTQYFFILLIIGMIIYFGWILKKKQLSVKSIKKEIEPNIAEEMAKKILEDAKMHRAVRKKENEK